MQKEDAERGGMLTKRVGELEQWKESTQQWKEVTDQKLHSLVHEMRETREQFDSFRPQVTKDIEAAMAKFKARPGWCVVLGFVFAFLFLVHMVMDYVR